MSRSFRWFASLASACVFIGAATVLLLADRATAVLDVSKSLTIRGGRAVERIFDIDVVDRDEIPASFEQAGHAVLWGTGMLVFGWLLRSRVPVLLTALFVAGASVMFEAAQPVVSATRRFEASDALANFAGIVLGVACVMLAISIERRLAFARIDPMGPSKSRQSRL